MKFAIQVGKIIRVPYWNPDSVIAEVPKEQNNTTPNDATDDVSVPLQNVEKSTSKRTDFQRVGFGASIDEPCHTKASKRFILNGYDNEWLFMAEVVERCTAIVYILAIIITPLTVFNVIPYMASMNKA